MAYSYWTRKGPIQGQGTEKDQWALIYHEEISTLVRDRDKDPLFPIVLVLFPAPVPFPVPCSNDYVPTLLDIIVTS